MHVDNVLQTLFGSDEAKWLADGTIAPHGVVGYTVDQPAGASRRIMRRLSRIDLVLLYRFTKDVTENVNRKVYAGQTCNNSI